MKSCMLLSSAGLLGAVLAGDIDDFEKYATRLRKRGIYLDVHEPQAFSQASHEVAPYQASLIAVKGSSPSQHYFKNIQRHVQPRADSPVFNYKEQVYMTKIEIGNQAFESVIDTGSADTWIAGAGFRCIVPKNVPGLAADADCRFPKLYNKSPTFTAKSGKFSISYAGEYLSGVLGTETISLGGVAVKNQELGLVNSGFWKGDGRSSGLIGLAFPSRSSTVLGLPSAKNAYSPIFTTMHRQNLIKPVFSIVLKGEKEGLGILALGGLPGPEVKTTGQWAKSPMQVLTFGGEPTPKAKKGPNEDYGLYRVTVDNFVVGGKTLGSKTQVNIDSGSSHMILPADIAKAFNGAFQPAAKFDRNRGWVVSCTAKPPALSIKINGITFKVAEQDLIIPPEFTGADQAYCTSAVDQSAWPGGTLLGASFLKNVVTVFDIGASELRFAARER